MELIEKLHLHDLIFLFDREGAFPVDATPGSPYEPPDPSVSVRAAAVLSSLLHLPSSPFTLPPLHPLLTLTVSSVPATLTEISPTIIKRLYLSAGLLPLYDLCTREKKRIAWVGEKIVHDGVKWPTTDRGWVVKAREASGLLSEGVRTYGDSKRSATVEDRAEIGTFISEVN
jgi:tRNA nucleotidyltransferase (CCA-adding enzyme)